MSKGLTVWTVEDGYGDTKLNPNGVPFLIPSFVTDFRPRPRDEFGTQSHQKHDYIAVKYHGQSYIVGNAASKLDMNIKWIGGRNKHNNPQFPVLFNSCLGLMATNQTQTVDCLTMGLPIIKDQTEKDQRISFLTDLAKGSHYVEVSDDGTHFHPKEITIKDVIVKEQPFGSLCDLILDHKGEITNYNIARGFNVIVDIGARTINILVVDGLSIIYDLTICTYDGMFTVYQQIGKFLEQQLGGIIPDGKLPTIFQEKRFNNLDLTEVIHTANQNHAYHIQRLLETLLIHSWNRVSNLIFDGGGSEILRPYLEKIYPQSNVIFLDRFAKSKGLRKYGIRQTLKKQREKEIQVSIGR